MENPMKRHLSLLFAVGLAVWMILGFFYLTTTAHSNLESNLPVSGELSRKSLTKLHPQLIVILSKTSSGERLPVVVELHRNPGIIQAALAAAPAQDKLSRRTALINALQQDAEKINGPLLSTLHDAERTGQASDVQSFWVNPIITLKASPKLIAEIATRTEVVQIRPDERFYLDETAYAPAEQEETTSGYPFNLQMIHVDLAQQALGLDGHGVVVANLDTGVDWQHPALMKKYRGYNPHGPAVHSGNWFVVTGEPYLYPGDGIGHGTHTMGTIVGDDGEGNRIGVAPGAQWIAVKLFSNQGFAYESWIHAAFQWIVAPNGNPALAPDIVNNSWGSSVGSDDRFRQDVAAIRAAGILAVFSAGNSGPNRGTIASPASYPESLAVGAVEPDKVIASFSSRGPSIWEDYKPEVVAPGVNIRSSFPGGGYYEADGTSQAGPHVVGLAALLLQADPSLTPDQLEDIIKSTTEPLGSVVPNNNSGWGLVNAYAAGLRVTSNGVLLGTVLSSNGSTIPQPIITASPRDSSGYTQTVVIAGDQFGTFSVALRPGRYDVTASAFGFNNQTQSLIEIITGTQTNLVFNLTPVPVGAVFGLVTDLQSGIPLSATLVVENTPIHAQTNPDTGAYSLALPSGSWQIKIIANAHRTGHITPTVIAGNGYPYDISLAPAPRILLVDSGRWYYHSQIVYYEDALNSLDYGYTLWPIRNPFGEVGMPSDLPSASTFSQYDLVIWSAPDDSPGILGMNDILTGFLKAGGNLLISGQEVAYLDASYPSGLPSQKYLTNYLGVFFSDEGNLEGLSGLPGAPLEGLTLTLNTSDSSQTQYSADSSILRYPTLSQAALEWPDHSIGAVTAKFCQPYKGTWLGFGIEGSGPRSQRVELMKRLIEWLSSPPDPYKILVTRPSPSLIGPPGQPVSGTFTIYNVGVLSSTFNLNVSGGSWGIDVQLPDGNHFNNIAELPISNCSQETLTYTINIPSEAQRNELANYQFFIQTQNDPNITATLTVSAKTPAPILFTDDERWYDEKDKYIRVLNRLGLPFDYIDTKGDFTPDTNIMNRYPINLWTTGYDWFAPLTAADENHLAEYLDQGGRLLLASQDLMDVRGESDFVRNRLGVTYATLSVTPTKAIAIPENRLNIDPEPWRLIYPFNNWSDGLIPTTTAQSVLIDQNLNNIGILHSANRWRTAFFSFPPETLEERARQTLLGQSLLWISPFGESQLEAPEAASAGSQIPVMLTLGIATLEPQNGLRAVLPLLPETSLVPGSIGGPWVYDATSNSLIWEGDLSPGITIQMAAGLQINNSIASGTVLSLIAQFYDPKGLVVVAEAPIQIGVPWIELDKNVSSPIVNLGDTVQFTITITNEGSISTTPYLTETLPQGLEIIPASISATTGSPIVYSSGFSWNNELPAHSLAQITYHAKANPPHPGIKLITLTDLSYPSGKRFDWASVVVPGYLYLPWVGQ